RQRRQAACIALDGDDAFGAECQDGARQAAGAGADLDHRMVLDGAGGAGDLLRQVKIEKEVLAERLPGVQPVPLDDVAKRRKSVGRGHRRLSLMACSLRASSSASRSAASRLSGRAMPLPASAKAVPWSGEVRMKGRPSVALTDVSKPSALA